MSAAPEPSSKRLKMQPSFAPAVDELHTFKRNWGGWTTIESEPVIWNQLLRDIGARNTQVQEIYGLDPESFGHVNPSHGIIFCLVFNTDYDKSEQETVCPEGLWFANQIPENACATYAILNIIMNSPSVVLSDELASFKDYSRTLTPPHKGLAVASFEFLKGAHNSFGRKSEMDEWDLGLVETFNASKRKSKAKEVKGRGRKSLKEVEEGLDEEDLAYHYIAYVHVDGAIWELDGLKRQPVKFHTCPEDQWLACMGPKLRERIALYPDAVGRFACLALVPESLPTYRAELTTNAILLGTVEAALQAADPEWRNFLVEDTQDLYTVSPTDETSSTEVEEIMEIKSAQKLLDRRTRLCIEQADLKRKISDCEREAADEAVIVERTRHDYEPFIKEAARILARNRKTRDIHDPNWRTTAARKRATRRGRGRPAKGAAKKSGKGKK